jgi:hypothetical protein
LALVALTANNLALLHPKAINLSFTFSGTSADGRSLITQFVDWSAQSNQQNVLYVVAQDENVPGGRHFGFAPADNFNGMTIAALQQSTGDGGNWNQVSPNMSQASTRNGAVSLAAPGNNLQLTDLDDVITPYYDPDFGASSLAAPHVTATAALLWQAAKKSSQFDASQHTVMKAVLMNSADVVSGVLGVTKTIYDQQGKDWTTGTPKAANGLSLQFGAGGLDAARAYQQLRGGEHNPDPVSHSTNIPAIGWSYSTASATPSKYVSTLFLPAHEWVDITLCWDRILSLNSVDGSGSFTNVDDTFNDSVFGQPDVLDVPVLNLYLMPAGATGLGQAVASVSGAGDTVAHIFQEVSPGKYQIWVTEPAGLGTPFALAWWLAPYGYVPPAASYGDFNGDGQITSSDYTAWKNSFGSTTNLAADGNSDGVVNAADYTVWRDHLGQSVPGSAAAVPEPSTLWLTLIGLVCCCRRTKRRGRE